MIRAVSVFAGSGGENEGGEEIFDWTALLGEGWTNVGLTEDEGLGDVDLWGDEDMQMLSSATVSRQRRGWWGRQRRGPRGNQEEEKKGHEGVSCGQSSIGHYFAVGLESEVSGVRNMRSDEGGHSCQCENMKGGVDSDDDKKNGHRDNECHEGEDMYQSEDEGEGEGDDEIENDEDVGGEEYVTDDIDSVVTGKRKDPFHCDAMDIILPGHPRGEMGWMWQYECMLVEVKGPTDRLSDMQQRWIHILNSKNICTLVCRVMEGRVMGLQGGHHETAGRDDL